jgi:hypothetical protein
MMADKMKDEEVIMPTYIRHNWPKRPLLEHSSSYSKILRNSLFSVVSNRPEPFGADKGSAEYGFSKQSMFKINLEDWIIENVTRDCHRNDNHKATINAILESYTRGIQANVEFYQEMAKQADEDKEPNVYSYHKLMAEIYRSLIPKAEL